MKKKLLQTAVSVLALLAIAALVVFTNRQLDTEKNAAVDKSPAPGNSSSGASQPGNKAALKSGTAQIPTQKEFALRTDPMFATRLFPIGKGGQDANLEELLESLSSMEEKQRFTEIEKWLSQNPDSRWSHALRFQLADYQFKNGYFSQAETSWDVIWEAVKVFRVEML